MNVAIIGTGYVETVTGTCFAELGHNGVCVDIDAAKVDPINAGIPPIHEPGIPALLRTHAGIVDDVVDANMLAAMSRSQGEVFNVGGGTRISVNELIEVMENVTGRKAVVKYIEKQSGDVKDADKICKLGWKLRVGIEGGVRRFVEWYGELVNRR